MSLLEVKSVKEAAVDNKKSNITEAENKTFKTNDTKAKSIIIQCVSDRHIEYIRDANTAFEMMSALSKIFERKSTISKLLIRKKLLILKCNISLSDHCVKFDTLIRQMESMGAKLDQDVNVCHLLLAIPKRCNSVITLSETMDTTSTEI